MAPTAMAVMEIPKPTKSPWRVVPPKARVTPKPSPRGSAIPPRATPREGQKVSRSFLGSISIPAKNMTKKIPNSAIRAREWEGSIQPSRGGPRINPAKNSPSMKGSRSRCEQIAQQPGRAEDEKQA